MAGQCFCDVKQEIQIPSPSVGFKVDIYYVLLYCNLFLMIELIKKIRYSSRKTLVFWRYFVFPFLKISFSCWWVCMACKSYYRCFCVSIGQHQNTAVGWKNQCLHYMFLFWIMKLYLHTILKLLL